MIRHFQYKKICLGRDYLQEHFSDSFNLSKVAKYSCMSQYHFSRIFTNVFGESPNTFVARLRIEKAKNMLITEKFSIGEICERVGYTSVGSFSSLFKKQVGMSPTQYRRKLWGLSNESLAFPMQSIPLCYSQNLFGFKNHGMKKRR
ncbi:MAG: AraC family transcriptional regulator [Xanthomonadales bacterium]|nr:AraC family transcriptional regulator [Xanthomonadales bacterium]